MGTFFFFFLFFCTLTSSTPSCSFLRGNSRPIETFPQSTHVDLLWQKLDRVVPGTESLRVHVALRQSPQGLEKLEQLFQSRSDPSSGEYGAYLSQQQVADLVAPDKEGLRMVQEWLSCWPKEIKEVELVGGGAYVAATVSISAAQTMFGTTFSYFQSKMSSRTFIRSSTGTYTIPAVLHDYVAMVAGVARLPASTLHAHATGKALSKTDLKTDPPTLRQMYQLGMYTATNSNTSQAVASFLDEHYQESDTKFFFEAFDPIGIYRPITKVIGAATGPPTLEASLDVQYISAIGMNVSTWVWTDDQTHAQQEPFLAWLISIAGFASVPQVHSCSYADFENSVTPEYIAQVNTELMKAAVRGLSMLFASGDNGVGCNKAGNRFAPMWPASSPYATAVGATQKGTGSKTKEDAWLDSGGGFSDVFAQPSYQKQAVSNYLATAKLPPTSFFNSSGRGVPDVSAFGTFFSIIVDQNPSNVLGTSAATPVWAGIISLLNDKRLNQGLPVLGFLNPWLYQNPDMFNDITIGDNGNVKCNEGNGFICTKGWDALSGLGTPNFPLLMKAANVTA
mmetsp:Transcript_9638/g.18340  ORF Transcript_9638/g.18340 Transcript_9638/m.18340 type:complete len:564 (-) Transcript_9638:147-1838(-)